jgi:hypothetical protein
MTVLELRDFLIERGTEDTKKTEIGSNQLGAIEGFEMCKTLFVPVEFENKIQALNEESQKISMRRPDLTQEEIEQYWRIRYQCLQVEFVYERLKCAWGYLTLSARAAIDYSNILEQKEKNA